MRRSTNPQPSPRVTEERTSHSVMGVASCVLSVLSGLFFGFLVTIFYLIEYLDIFVQDDVGWAFLFLLGIATILLCETAALVLGVAGLFQRRRKRTSALLGVLGGVLGFFVLYVQPIWKLPPGNF